MLELYTYRILKEYEFICMFCFRGIDNINKILPSIKIYHIRISSYGRNGMEIHI